MNVDTLRYLIQPNRKKKRFDKYHNRSDTTLTTKLLESMKWKKRLYVYVRTWKKVDGNDDLDNVFQGHRGDSRTLGILGITNKSTFSPSTWYSKLRSNNSFDGDVEK